jgi:transcriptional regulator with XRE-family HTH domain
MDWIRLGLAYRALRIRRGWRQIDLARRAGVSRSEISRIERGLGAGVAAGILARVAAALDARLDLALRWRGEALDRLLDSAHARLVEQVVAILSAAGWDVAVEVSFAIAGERGSIDLLALHRATGRLLVVEVKSVVPDIQAMLHALDRKVRLGPRIAADRGWGSRGAVGRLLVVADGTTARRRVAALGATFATVLPARGRAVRAWLRAPAGPMAGLLFLPPPIATGARVSRSPTGVSRVRGPRRSALGADSSPSARDGNEWRGSAGPRRRPLRLMSASVANGEVAESDPRPSPQANRQRIAPPGSVVPTPNAVSGTIPYTYHGGGPALGALYGAVNASPATSAGQPWARYIAATFSSSTGSVIRLAVPSITRSTSSSETVTTHAGFAARFRLLRVPGPETR